MTPSALNTLFGVPASQAASAKPASNSTAFGDMLSREINGRQPAAPPPQNSRADNPPSASREPQPTAANPQKPAERQNLTARQNQQAEAPQKDQQADAPLSSAPAVANVGNTPAAAKDTAASGVDKTAKASKKDKADKTDKTNQSDAAASADDPTAVSAASAELLALVASLMPKSAGAAIAADPAAAMAVTAAAAAAAAAGATGAINPNAVFTKGTALNLAADAVAGAADAATDPAFAALLAQAANSSAARGQAKSEAAVSKAVTVSDTLPAGRTDADPAQARNTAGNPAVLAMKTDEIVLAAAAQTTGAKVESVTLSGVAGLGSALPVGLTQAASGAPPDTLTPHVGTPAWDHALGQKIVWMAAGAQQSASLTLNPPDRGPIPVIIHVSNDQANASFTAAQPEVRQALEAALPRLKEMLGDAGITLGQASVSAGNPNQSGAADQRAGSGPRRGNGAADHEPLDTEPVTRSMTRIVSGGTGMVDTFA